MAVKDGVEFPAPSLYLEPRERRGHYRQDFAQVLNPQPGFKMTIIEVIKSLACTIPVQLRDGAGNGLPGINTASIVVKLKKQGESSFTTITPTSITDVGLGFYDIVLTATHTNTLRKAALIVSAPNVLTRDDICLDVVDVNKYDTAAFDGVMARLGAPAGASVSADIAAVKADTAGIYSATATISGQVSTVLENCASLLGLNHHNSVIDNQIYANGIADPNRKLLTDARIRKFADDIATSAATRGAAADADGESQRYIITAVYNADDQLIDYRLVSEIEP